MRNHTIPLLLSAGALLAGCGAAASGSTGSGSGPSSDKHAQGVAFATCMRSHGVSNFPDPKTGSEGNLQFQSTPGHTSVNGVSVNGPAFQRAMQSCRSKLPNGGKAEPLNAARKQAMLRFSQCMRAHGVTGFPDPTFPGGGGAQIRIDKSMGVNPQSPAFTDAQQACGSALGKPISAGGP
jgi:hypothetical protein